MSDGTTPPTRSANPSASLPVLWKYIKPTLTHLICSPTHDTSKAPPLDVTYYMGIHTALYEYLGPGVRHSSATSPSSNDDSCGLDLFMCSNANPCSMDLYMHLDKYFTDVAHSAAVVRSQTWLNQTYSPVQGSSKAVLQ